MSGVAAARRFSILTACILWAPPVEGLAEEPSAQVFEVVAGVNGDSSASLRAREKPSSFSRPYTLETAIAMGSRTRVR